MTRKLIKILITFFLSLSISLSLYAVTKDPTVAKVNGIKIKKSVFDETYRQNMLLVSNKRVTKRKVLSDLINRILGIQRAKKNKLDKDPVVRKKMEDVMYHAQVSKDLEAPLNKIKVTDADVKRYYKNHKEYRTAHILLRVRAQPEDDEVKAALQQIFKIHKAVEKKPSAFPELANKYSQSTTAHSGGDMGFQPSIRMAPEYFKAISGKPVGFISKPVQTQFGFHIIKILAVRDFKDINLPFYKKIIHDTVRDRILGKYYKNLRKGASIQIDKKYLQ